LPERRLWFPAIPEAAALLLWLEEAEKGKRAEYVLSGALRCSVEPVTTVVGSLLRGNTVVPRARADEDKKLENAKWGSRLRGLFEHRFLE
jgi:hypothetical protein